jgi:hypothetical protein
LPLRDGAELLDTSVFSNRMSHNCDRVGGQQHHGRGQPDPIQAFRPPLILLGYGGDNPWKNVLRSLLPGPTV